MTEYFWRYYWIFVVCILCLAVFCSSGCVMMSKKKLDKVIRGAMIYGYMQGERDCEASGEFNKALEKMIEEDTDRHLEGL